MPHRSPKWNSSCEELLIEFKRFLSEHDISVNEFARQANIDYAVVYRFHKRQSAPQTDTYNKLTKFLRSLSAEPFPFQVFAREKKSYEKTSLSRNQSNETPAVGEARAFLKTTLGKGLGGRPIEVAIEELSEIQVLAYYTLVRSVLMSRDPKSDATA